MKNYQKLKDEVFDFYNPIISTWSEEEAKMSREKFQMQYLYSQAVGASSACESFGILRENKQYRECKILCRTLLERIAKSQYSGISDINAIERVIHEIHLEIRAIERFQDGRKCDSEPNSRISSLEEDLKVFQSLLGSETCNPDKSLYKIFEEIDLEHLHRGIYSKYCEYSHGTFLSGLGDTTLSKIDDYISLLSPIICAFTLHHVNCTDENCTIDSAAEALVRKIAGLLRA